MSLSAQQLTIASLGLLALALLGVASVLVVRELRRSRSERVIGNAIRRDLQIPRDVPTAAGAAGSNAMATDAFNDLPAGNAPELPAHWLDTRIGRMLVADEDRRLIDQCGLPSLRSQLIFLVLRASLAISLPLLSYAAGVLGLIKSPGAIALTVAFVAGFMIPKLVLSRWAAARRERVAHELPLFVDLLRLLQGVGLSLDQSLQIMATDFGHVLRVLGGELLIANRQYSQGRTREHSLQRLASLHGNEGLAGLVALLVQVDRHGGAVQEPLRQFSERLREARRAELKGKIGKITVKMTGVMVATLLPALIIVTAGPGFLAIIRSLGALSK